MKSVSQLRAVWNTLPPGARGEVLAELDAQLRMIQGEHVQTLRGLVRAAAEGEEKIALLAFLDLVAVADLRGDE